MAAINLHGLVTVRFLPVPSTPSRISITGQSPFESKHRTNTFGAEEWLRAGVHLELAQIDRKRRVAAGVIGLNSLERAPNEMDGIL